MANKYLKPLYKMLFDQDFDFSDSDHRIKMQRSVYLLQNMGVPVGDYGFRWYASGPYSQELRADSHYESERTCAELTFRKEYAEVISKLHDAIHSNERADYSACQWVDCLACIHYLCVSILPYDATEDEVVQALEKRKENLDNRNANVAANRLIQNMFEH